MNFGKYIPSEMKYNLGGVLLLFKFNNNYGASVVRHMISYGGECGLWELAVLKFDSDSRSDLCFDTPVTGDVLGYLNEADVEKYLKEIEELAPYEQV